MTDRKDTTTCIPTKLYCMKKKDENVWMAVEHFFIFYIIYFSKFKKILNKPVFIKSFRILIEQFLNVELMLIRIVVFLNFPINGFSG